MVDIKDIDKVENETPSQAAIRALACVAVGFKMGGVIHPDKLWSPEEIEGVIDGVIEDIRKEPL